MLAHLLLLGTLLASSPGPVLPQIAAVPPQKIKHVIVIVQENRSFDNVFHGFPGVDTVNSGKGHRGQTIPLKEVSFLFPEDLNHSHNDFLQQFDKGKMDGFDLERPNAELDPQHPKPADNLAYSYLPQREVQPYWDMAKQYVVADRMFESNSGPSYTAHQYLIAAQSGGTVDNPNILDPKVDAWGCDSPKNAKVDTLWDYGDGHGVFPCFDYPTLGDLLDDAKVAWRYYAPSFGELGAIWSAYDAIKHIRYGPDWKQDVINPETRVLGDIGAHRLAQFSWVIPNSQNSDHAWPQIEKFNYKKLSSATGPSWVTSIVNAVGKSEYWNDTAIFILWDDWGGWYDHVPPPQLDRMSLGMRVPLIVVSPYAKSGYVSHTQHEFGSILKFAEGVFNLPSLHGVDDRSDDLSDCFDFGQSPRAFTSIAAPAKAAFFFTQGRSDAAPDDD